ncbi:DegT/DnrJ/EryC1/StrS family aminotransferase [Candidatus Woesearchaeota archaeon]|nr:DegT/DnrJ/EryC1/StrS family aminotransferase [Candidatus Woesearchaeota archaeon]
MGVSYNNYKRMNEFLRQDIKKELEILLSLDNDYALFKYQYENEKQIGKMLGSGYSVGTSSGTAALQFCLVGLGIGENDEVITVPHTYIATLLPISNTGAIPVLADVLGDTMLIDPDKIEERITEKTKAIMPVHLYGQMANMDKIRKIGERHNLMVIEDAAQAHLGRYGGKLPGNKSHAACYSFYLNKVLGGISNGGIVITKSRKLQDKIRILRNPESNDPLVLKSLRTPAYLDWEQIAFIKCKIKHLREWLERRREIAKMYNEELAHLPIILPKEDKKAYHVYRDFVIRANKRDKLVKYLSRKGIETNIHYEQPVHLSLTYKYLGYKKGDFPVSESICQQAISLPVNPFLANDEIFYTIRKIKDFFK